MTRIKTLMIWIGLLLSLASCKDSLEAITLGGDELPTEEVTLSIQLPNFTPQEISTRAGGETTESITSLWLVCYDTSDNYLDMQDCTKAYADAICSTFKNKPAECSEKFQDVNFDPMFGFTT